MAEIVSIATAVPQYCHRQSDILHFMQDVYQLDESAKRKLRFLYEHSGIGARYSVVEDFSLPANQRTFLPSDNQQPFPSLEKRMAVYNREALKLSREAIENCIGGWIKSSEITHLITVSCTGMSAPGLDLQLMQEMNMPTDIFRTSVNFMGCYAAIHALKLAQMICSSSTNANVVIVATELCTLHFQEIFTEDNAASSLLFADGAAAVLVSNHQFSETSLHLHSFYSQVAQRGEADMAWQLSSKGFLMTLSGYIPQLISEDIAQLVENAMAYSGMNKTDITHWCIHPGGKRILDLIQQKLCLPSDALDDSRSILSQYGNMSSPTVLFVLKEIMRKADKGPAKMMGMAFGPGLTMETFIATRS